MSNHQNNDNRAKKPMTLAGVIGSFMQSFGPRVSDNDLIMRWNEIMGPDISNICVCGGIKKTPNKKFNIIVKAKHPAFVLQLSYQQDEITKRINKYFGYNAIEKITFRK